MSNTVADRSNPNSVTIAAPIRRSISTNMWASIESIAVQNRR